MTFERAVPTAAGDLEKVQFSNVTSVMGKDWVLENIFNALCSFGC